MFKKILFALFVVTATAVTVVSCSKEDIYSCDPVINQWTKSNIQSIKTMTRSNWVAVGNIHRQRAVYVAFTSEQKENLWRGKIQETLELNWSDAEKAHLESLLTFINNNPSFFGNNGEITDQEKDNQDIFFYSWTEYAKTTFGWSDKLIYGIAYTPERLADKEGNLAFIPMASTMTIDSSESGSGGSGGALQQCDCLSTLNNKYRCPNYCSTAKSCRGILACGYLWSTECNGLCK